MQGYAHKIDVKLPPKKALPDFTSISVRVFISIPLATVDVHDLFLLSTNKYVKILSHCSFICIFLLPVNLFLRITTLLTLSTILCACFGPFIEI